MPQIDFRHRSLKRFGLTGHAAFERPIRVEGFAQILNGKWEEVKWLTEKEVG